eukprot:ctg_5660.g549
MRSRAGRTRGAVSCRSLRISALRGCARRSESISGGTHSLPVPNAGGGGGEGQRLPENTAGAAGAVP